MSRLNKPPSDDHLVNAAELRIGNHTWEHVAAKLHRSPESVRRWPLKYPDRWRTAMHHAERRLAVDSEAEAVVALRVLLRDKESKIRCSAAKAILSLRLELAKIDIRAQPRKTSELTEMEEAGIAGKYLQNLTDEELEHFATVLVEDEAREAAAIVQTVPVGAA